MLSDSGGCARKRAAMSVKLTAVKRVQSSPNLLTAGITINNHGVSQLNGIMLHLRIVLCRCILVETTKMASQHDFFY